MSDGHSDSVRYSKFYRADQEAKDKNESSKLEKMCLVLKDETVVQLDGVQLFFSEKNNKSINKVSPGMLTEDGSRLINLTELIRRLIKDGMV
jgi:hypothetical protein